jgi:hypothetical protein
LLGLELVSTHTPPQLVVPPTKVHRPETHVVPPPHTMPQPPQSTGSFCVSTQPPPQLVVPVGQLVAHTPPAQT